MAPLRVSIAAVKIKNYRSCKKTVFSLDPEATALIGPNGAGKTNALSALKLLSSRPRRSYEDDPEGAFERPCYVEVDFAVRKKVLKYKGRFLLRLAEGNADVVVDRTDKWNFSDFGLENNWVEVATRGAGHFYTTVGDSVIQVRPGRPALYVLGAKASERQIVTDTKVLSAYQATKEFMSRISYYSASGFTNPALCPTSFEIGDPTEGGRLGVRPIAPSAARKGAHLTFLRNLYAAKQDDSALYDRYLSVVGRAGAGLIEKIHWKPSTFQTVSSEVQSGGKIIKRRTKRTLVIPTVVIGGDELSFNQLSEGTFRALAILFYILRGGRELMLLEEPEVCVHYGLLDTVISVIREVSHTKQIVLSTHSDAILDMLAPESLRLTRLAGSRGTLIDKLSQRMSAKSLSALRDYLENTGSLGEYWRHGGFN